MKKARERLVGDHFGAHVVAGNEDVRGIEDERRGKPSACDRLKIMGGACSLLCEPKITDLQVIGFREEKIFRFQITMRNVLGVHGGET
jgi:hypothetical protein